MSPSGCSPIMLFNAEIQVLLSMLIPEGLHMCADIVIIVDTIMEDEVL